jgi:hypothetical protein
MSRSSFEQCLVDSGWTRVSAVSYRKATWQLFFDTSSWMELGTADNQRVFDIPDPEEGREDWTLKLIEHLASVEDELHRLRRL